MEREAFLDHIADRLGRPRVKAAPGRPVKGVPDFYRLRPMGEDTQDGGDLCGGFQAELEKLGGQVIRVAGLSGAHQALREQLRRWEPKGLVSWAREEFEGWDLDWLWREFPCLAWDHGPPERFRESALAAHMGITTADWLIANTGTLVLRHGLGRPRSASLTPSVHLALAREEQVLSRLGEAFELAGPGLADCSNLQMISGPSRTSDIENDSTIGVHGPAAVVVILMREPS